MNPATIHQTDIRSLSPREAYEICSKNGVMLDIREEYLNQFKKFGVPDFVQIPLSQLEKELSRVPKDKVIIVADSSGLHCREACAILERSGYTQIALLAGGMVEWERDGMPLIVDPTERLSGSCACQLRPREQKREGDPKT